MPVDDEPLFRGDESKKPVSSERVSQLVTRIRGLVTEQLYGVLCTQGQGQP